MTTFAAFLEHIGAPVERHLRSEGLPAYCDNPNAFVPLKQAWSFFDTTAQSEDSMLAWHVGRFFGDRNLNSTFLRRLEGAPTLYQALKNLVQMISAEASHLQLGIRERRDDILLCTHYSDMKRERGYHSVSCTTPTLVSSMSRPPSASTTPVTSRACSAASAVSAPGNSATQFMIERGCCGATASLRTLL